ncbi:enoyl-ACP reductase FabI [Streptomyces qinglanensis]|uniref:Enoyl-[acyl-carrier-protein] reductase [NADH] n=1 Tax=Streptomyces qinglanensis TaxID=943816 RepID=A0A1H9QZ94_9ACTN|nr:enoyl-ACP reductase FabI [Streptomyces qinglanensis]SER65033.1 enoyl-[acyl-carrier protein] reductase I [Streptomyces qinglanensis]
MSTCDLTGRHYLVTGVTNQESIAWHVAAALQRAGAEVVLSSFGRTARIARKAAARLPCEPDVLELDVTDEDDFARLAEELRGRWGALDGVLHSVAYAPADAVSGAFLETPAAGALRGFQVSAYSLQRLAAALAPLLTASEHGGSIVGVTVDSSRALPGYDWMGVFKSTLEAVARYLALHLGPHGVRVNLVAAGPLETLSAQGIGSFEALAEHYERWAPLGWDRTDPGQVVGAVLFLLSDLAAHTTGQILHADGGLHAVAGGIGEPPR